MLIPDYQESTESKEKPNPSSAFDFDANSHKSNVNDIT